MSRITAFESHTKGGPRRLKLRLPSGDTLVVEALRIVWSCRHCRCRFVATIEEVEQGSCPTCRSVGTIRQAYGNRPGGSF